MNFNFLKKEVKYNNFSTACLEAERSLMVSNATCAILTRRALELAVKWVYSYDSDLAIPYQDNLGSLIHGHTFRDIIDLDILPKLKYIQKLGNKAVHTSKVIKREEAVHTLSNLFEGKCKNFRKELFLTFSFLS